MHIDTQPLAATYSSSPTRHTPHTLRETSTNPILKTYLHPLPPSLHSPTTKKRIPKSNIYLVAKEKALAILDQTTIRHTLREALTKLVGTKPPHISLNLLMTDPQHTDRSQSYTDPTQKYTHKLRTIEDTLTDNSKRLETLATLYTRTDHKKRGIPP